METPDCLKPQFHFDVFSRPDRCRPEPWQANAYLTAGGDREVYLATEHGSSPAAAIEAAENAARMALEKLLGIYQAKAEEVLR